MALDPDALLHIAHTSRKRALATERAADELRRIIQRTLETVRISRNLIASSDSAIHRFRTLAINCRWTAQQTRGARSLSSEDNIRRREPERT